MRTRIVSSTKVLVFLHAKHHYCWAVLQAPQGHVSIDILQNCDKVQYGNFMLKVSRLVELSVHRNPDPQASLASRESSPDESLIAEGWIVAGTIMSNRDCKPG